MHPFDRVLAAFPAEPVESLEAIRQQLPDMDMNRIERIVQRARVAGFIRSTDEGHCITALGTSYLQRRLG